MYRYLPSLGDVYTDSGCMLVAYAEEDTDRGAPECRRYREATDPVERSQYQIVWLLSRGKTTSEV
jgi:hypothetical protein